MKNVSDDSFLKRKKIGKFDLDDFIWYVLLFVSITVCFRRSLVIDNLWQQSVIDSCSMLLNSIRLVIYFTILYPL